MAARVATRCATRGTGGCPASPGRAALVLFGVTGDLARKKLMPAIYDLANRGLLPPGFAPGRASPAATGPTRTSPQIVHDVGARRTPGRRSARRSGSSSPRASGSCRATSTTTRRSTGSPRRSTSSTSSAGTGGNHAFYLSIPPAFFARSAEQLDRARPGRRRGRRSWRRVVIEKPFGHDLKSAPRAERRSSSGLPAGRRSSGSTTTWARRRCRTSWRCASPTSCSSRSGTPTTSTTSRSPWPRTSASAAGPATTTASAPPATSSRTTCCSCWP